MRVAVIGAGIIGQSIAFDLCRRGVEVVLLDHQELGTASRVAGGMLTPSAEVLGLDRILSQVAVESCRMHQEFYQELWAGSCELSPYRRDGTLLIALHRNHWAELEQVKTRLAEFGLQSETLLRKELLELEPLITPRNVGGLYFPKEYQVDPRKLIGLLENYLSHHPACTVIQAQALGLVYNRDSLRGVRHSLGTLEADQVIACSGAWTSHYLPEELKIPLRPVKGQSLLLRGQQLLNRVLRSPEVYLVPRRDGYIYLGASSEEVGFDSKLRAGAILELLHQAWSILPGLAEHELVEQWVGLRPSLTDHLPVIGSTALEGLWLATGYYRHGIMLAPYTAHHLGEALIHKTPLSASFSPHRFLKRSQYGTHH